MSRAPVVLVTGATDGIGRETARVLAARGARVVLHGRSASKLAATREAIEQATGRRLPEPVLCDLASLAAVRELAAALAAQPERPTVLLHNAGVYMRRFATSPDGFELTMAVNHLAPFLLTHLLLGSAGQTIGRVVNVSSVAHQRGAVDPDDVGLVRRSFEPYGHYAASKLANVLFTVELARRVRARGVAVNALHPGVVSTKLLTEGFGMQGGDSLEEGAATSVLLALEPVGASAHGRYFAAGREAPMSPLAADARLARRFYEASAEAVGVAPLPVA
ncbi:MAG: SDR family NAD(P)-dependent oxidoreductase [Polyangiaceae bacterium]|nr:SDR family NAD(P)-dependent oxidoreductase [Polyangiaceae bacterium]